MSSSHLVPSAISELRTSTVLYWILSSKLIDQLFSVIESIENIIGLKTYAKKRKPRSPFIMTSHLNRVSDFKPVTNVSNRLTHLLWIRYSLLMAPFNSKGNICTFKGSNSQNCLSLKGQNLLPFRVHLLEGDRDTWKQTGSNKKCLLRQK